MVNYHETDILSHPIKLRWLGWESNTYALQAAGWELSANQNMEYKKMQLAFRHTEMQMRGLSDYINFDYFQRRSSLYDVLDTNQSMPMFGCRIANNITIDIREPQSMVEFNPIDARPMYINIEKRTLDDMAHFRKIDIADNEIFLKSASMDDILNMALERQEPRQNQIRKEMVHRQELDVMRNSQLKAHLRLVV